MASLGARGQNSLEEVRIRGPLPVDLFAAEFVRLHEPRGHDAHVKRLGYEIGQEIRRRFEIASVHRMGAGDYGLVGLVEGTRDALKLTADGREIAAATRLVDQELAHVAPLHAAGTLDYRVKTRLERWELPVHVLVYRAVDWVGLETTDEDEKLDKAVVDVKIEHSAMPFQTLLRENVMGPIIMASIAIRNELYIMGHPFRQVAQGLQELQDRGIYLVDVHSGNLGWSEPARGFQIFDLGFSLVTGV